MTHEERHPWSGKTFRINIGEDSEAIYDRHLHGKLIRLDDWADRLEQSALSTRQIEVLLSFYAHRCLPDLPPSDGVPWSALNLDGIVYGTVIETIGTKFVELVVLRETELAEA